MFHACAIAPCLLLVPVAWCGADKKADSKQGSVKELKLEGELTAADPKENDRHFKVHTFKMEQGKTYVIDMVGRTGDACPYLVLKDSNGKVLAQDDDREALPNSQITFIATKTGTYKIVATSFSGGTGKYRLTVWSSAAIAEFKSMQSQMRAQAQKVFTGTKVSQKQLGKLTELAVPYVEKLDKFVKANRGDPAAKMAEKEINGMLHLLVQSSASPANKLVRRMVEKARQAQQRFIRGQALCDRYESAYRRGEKDKAAKIAAEAEDLLTKARDAGGPLTKQAEDALFVLKGLSIGKVAPEIEGEDMEGKKFKLSDYRGKVVVIDYWAFW